MNQLDKTMIYWSIR